MNWHSLTVLLGFAPLVCASAQSGEPFRLHAYANLVQVPTLVVGFQTQAVTGLPTAAFRISLDDGPKFPAVSTRIEGNDPLNIVILLDATGSVDSLLTQFPSAIADLAKRGLQAHDHITLFAVDCTLVQSGYGSPTNPDDLQKAAAKILNNASLHIPKRRPSCSSEFPLWDAIALSAKALTEQDGRRVLLVVSQGRDRKSQLPPIEVDHFIAGEGITLFSLNEYDDLGLDPLSNVNSNIGSRALLDPTAATAAMFDELVRDNGGLALHTRPKNLSATLQQWIELVRSRYLIEFHRPDGAIVGRHNIVISVEHQHKIATIRSSGVGIENSPDAARDDGNTVPSAPSEALYGKKKPQSSDR